MLACSDPPMARPSSDAWRTGSGWQQPETLRRTAAGSCKGRRRSGLTEQRDAVSPKSAILNIQRNRGALFASFCPKSSPFCQNSVTGSVTFSGRLNIRHWRLPVPLDFAGDQHRFHRFARMLPIFYAIIINAAQGPSRAACCLHLFERGGVLDSTGIVRAQAAGSGDASASTTLSHNNWQQTNLLRSGSLITCRRAPFRHRPCAEKGAHL